MKSKWRISWEDPHEGELKMTVRVFEDGETLSAKEQAHDWAYTAADKGRYEVEYLGVVKS
jgi:hypothetical protein